MVVQEDEKRQMGLYIAHLESTRQHLSVLVKICQTVHLLLSISTGQGTLTPQLPMRANATVCVGLM